MMAKKEKVCFHSERKYQSLKLSTTMVEISQSKPNKKQYKTGIQCKIIYSILLNFHRIKWIIVIHMHSSLKVLKNND
jgi:hypothetical protein